VNLLADPPFEGTPPEPAATWKWYNGLAAAVPQRQPQQPSQIVAGQLVEHPTLASLAAALAERLAGAEPVLRRSVATLDSYDTFPAFSVYAREPGASAEPDLAAGAVAWAAVQKTTAAELLAAIAAAQGAQSLPRAA